jgi:hypothetical protein
MMMNLDFLKLVIKIHNISLILVFCFFLSCQEESKYSKILKKELKSGKVYNDLIFDIKIGQTRDDFFKKCYELNQKKLITSGGRELYPEYIMYPKDESNNSKKIKMSFFGIFDDDNIIKGLDLRFNYYTWSSWNKELSSDYLIEEIRDTLLLWFPGNNFFALDLENDEKFAYIKIDGNRRIRVYKIDAKDVAVKIEDISQNTN